MAAENPPLRGQRILVVEDEYFVARGIVDLLEKAGARVVGPIGFIDEAIAFLSNDGETLDAAVLDVNLHGTLSYPLADKLLARSVRFVFATGYDAGVIEGKYQHIPRCEKPFNERALLAALARA